MKKIICTWLGIVLLGFLTVGVAQAENDPVSMLRSIADQLISSLESHKANLKTNPSLVYSLANRIVVPHADLAEMSKRVLPSQTWDQATSGQRAQFQTEFTKLLVRTYATALADYKGQTVEFYPVRGGYQGKNNVKVDSRIIPASGPTISVSYKLILEGVQWKLYDLSV
ncbi:MAG TPA: ABC transporter substrate-binding protein, partial [Gammaproteobacteria bacterium]|nr:ABC transporter substrate-binding protein [Gammaproteobacteria bacterium]